ncbi:MAG: InlB B-repeat-containing protein [Clostridiales bacterium]|nr:InlB B-repeat-containing protein [Clostridiales bacterium]
MAKSQFTKKKIRLFVVILIVVAVASLAVGVGIHFYIGHHFDATDISAQLGDKLNIGSSFTVEDIIESENYSYGWVKSNVNVEVLIANPEYNSNDESSEQEEYIVTQDILDYDAATHTFTVVGIAQGTIVISNPVDASIKLEVPFKTKFASVDTERILKDEDNYPSFYDDGCLTRDEIAGITTLKIKNNARVDMADFAAFPELTKVIIRNVGQVTDVLEVENLNLLEQTHIYVPQDSYLKYMGAWSDYADKIYVITSEIDSVSVIFDKMGGILANDDNGLSFENTEAKAGTSLNISQKYSIAKKGYTFLGWFVDNGGVTEEVTDNYVFTQDTKIVARWKAYTYTVKLHHNNLTNDITERIFTYDVQGTLFGSASAPTYQGCTLIGWAYANNATAPVFEPNEKIVNLTDVNNDVIELYAVWAYDEFTIEFYNGDTLFKTIQGKYNQTVSLAGLGSPFNSKGDFIGWAYSPDALKPDIGKNEDKIEGVYVTPVTGNTLKLYALFEPAFYSIYYSVGDATPQPDALLNWSRGEPVQLAPAVNLTGYRFKGWQDESGFIYTPFEDFYQQSPKTRELLSNYVALEGIHTTQTTVTLTPVWEANTFYVQFAKGEADSMFSTGVVTYGRSYSITGTATRTGYNWTGMKSNVGNVTLTDRTISANNVHTLYMALKGSTSDNDFNNNSTVTFESSWSIIYYTVKISEDHVSITVKDGNGTAISNGATVPYNTKLTVTFKAKTDYKDPWCKVNGKEVSSGYSFNVSGDVSITSGATKTCVTSGTLITMADGTTKKVEDVKVGDSVLAWDFASGSWVVTTVTLNVYHGDDYNTVINLIFSNGRHVKIVGMHVFFDITLRQYIEVDLSNCMDFVGDNFMSYNENTTTYEETKLINAYVTTELTGAYSIITAYHYNCITEGIVSATPSIPGYYELVSSYINEDMSFNYDAFEADLQQYGLYEYELFAECLTYQQYEELCAGYYKLAVVKGFTTFEEIYKLMMMYSYIY